MSRKKWTLLAAEMRRKALHLLITMVIFLFIDAFTSWQKVLVIIGFFVVFGYPILAFLEKHRLFASFFAQRSEGEVKSSLVLISLTVAFLTLVFWGFLGTAWKYVILVAILAWGYGDAAACLVGKLFGKRFLEHRLIEGRKTVEGTVAMLLVSLAAVFFTMLKYAGLPWYICLAVAAVVAPISALTELFSLKGVDTLTVPIAAAFATFGMAYLFLVWGLK